MSVPIVLDIETIARPASQGELEHWRKRWTPPANYKDPVKIDAKRKEDEEKWLYKRQFTAAGARMISCAVCVVEEEIAHAEAVSSDDICDICSWLRDYLGEFHDYKLITYKGRTFDLPIVARSLADANVRLKKPVGKWGVVDLYEYPFYRTGGLKQWCKVFGIEFDDSIDGSNIAELYEAKRWEEIRGYNLEDVHITGELYYKLTALYEL